MDPILDSSGRPFHTGLLEPAQSNFVSAYRRVSADWTTTWTQQDIIDLITSSTWTPAVEIYPDDFVINGDQTNHNSCAGWGGANALSKTIYSLGNRNKVFLSGSYPYSLCNRNVDQGAALEDIMNALMQHGSPPASMCGPQVIWRSQTKRFDSVASQEEGIDLYSIGNELELAVALAQGSIVVVCFQVDRTYVVNFKDKTGSAVMKAFSGVGNHCVHCDDIRWNAAKKQFEYRIVNNWGIDWGYHGTAWVTFASFAQPITRHMFYRVTGVSKL